MVVDEKLLFIDVLIEKDNFSSSISPPDTTIHQLFSCILYFSGRNFVQFEESFYLFKKNPIVFDISAADRFVGEYYFSVCPYCIFWKQRHHKHLIICFFPHHIHFFILRLAYAFIFWSFVFLFWYWRVFLFARIERIGLWLHRRYIYVWITIIK